MTKKSPPRRRASWQEKLNSAKGLPKVVRITGKMSKRWLAGRSLGEGRETGTVAIPAPKEIYDLMAKVPKGKLVTINEIRQIIAKKHKASIGCPITCGIFAWVSANAAEEKALSEKRKASGMAYWRTLKSNGEINEKYPGGVYKQKGLLQLEGHKVIKKGNKFLVANFTNSLIKI